MDLSSFCAREFLWVIGHTLYTVVCEVPVWGRTEVAHPGFEDLWTKWHTFAESKYITVIWKQACGSVVHPTLLSSQRIRSCLETKAWKCFRYQKRTWYGVEPWTGTGVISSWILQLLSRFGTVRIYLRKIGLLIWSSLTSGYLRHHLWSPFPQADRHRLRWAAHLEPTPGSDNNC